MLTFTEEFFDTLHKWDFILKYDNEEVPITNYAYFVKHPPTQFDLVMQFFRAWHGLVEVIAKCDGIEISLEDIYNGNWRLIK